ncbi:MAG TPA: BatA domain-containing protein, partial [Gemmatimonadaceae bacterium]
MGLLAPLFLLGLAALAAPVVVHLMQRDRREAVEFPSLMFLQRIPFRTSRRQRIRHWPLFLLRCLALLLLVAAFARPFVRDRLAFAAGDAAREVVVLLDRSYSMGYGERWARASAAVGETIDALRPADRATLVLFDTDAAAGAPTSDPAALRAALDEARPGAGGTRYAPALRVARRILETSDRARREVVLVSDFQRLAWSGAGSEVRMAPGTEVRTMDVGEGETSNAAVTGVELGREREGGREWATVAARVVHRGDSAAGVLGATLELNGREIERTTIPIAAGGVGRVTFARVPLPEGESRAVVRLDADRLRADDAFHFTLAPGRSLSLLLVEPTGAAASHALYLTRALSIGRRPPIDAEVARGAALPASALAGRSVVVLHDAAPGEDAARRLRAWVERGGGLIVAAGERGSARAWPAALAEIMPGEVGEVVDRVDGRGGRLAVLDRSHPALAPFDAPRSGDFAAARFLRYRRLTPAADAAVLARFDDGTPALLERRVGEGRVMLWGGTLDAYWSDLALQPVYLPFVHQLARHAAAYADARAWRTVGEGLELPRAADGAAAHDAAGAPTVVVAPSGARTRIAADGARRVVLDEAGFYEIERAGGAGAG